MRKWLLSVSALLTLYLFPIPDGGVLLAQTATFSNPSACNLRQPIGDFTCSDDGAFSTPDRFAIEVNNAPGGALGPDVFLSEVRLLIRHPWAADLDLTLISPSGKRVLLSADNGGGNDNYGLPDVAGCEGYVVFSASSCLPIDGASAPFTDGSYQPEESLLRFNDGATAANGAWLLEICDDAPEDVGTLEFVELLFEPLSCLPLYAPEVLGVDATTVDLHWEPAGNCDGTVIVEYGFPGFQPGSDSLAGEGTVVFATCPPFSLEGLAGETDYEIYLRTYCPQSGNFSANTCPLQASTGCKPPPPTITENFDQEETCLPICGQPCPLQGVWRNTNGDNMDWLAYNGETSTLGTGPIGDISGSGNYVYIEATESGSCRPGSIAYLRSNCIQFDRSNTDTCHLSFNYHLQGGGAGTLRLELSEDGGFTWSPLWEVRGDQGSDWQKVYLSLSALTDGAVAQFRFVAVKGEGSKGDMALDEIVFHGSVDQGLPQQKYYVDADEDEFGDPDTFVESCATQPPAGYVTNGDDCDDSNPAVNPAAEEIPCDGIDNNCNGDADDLILPPPLPVHDTICSGEVPQVCAIPQSGKPILWYGSPDGNDFLGVFNECYTPVLPENNSPLPVVYRFYAEETDFLCRSGERTEVRVVVNPLPDISTPDEPAVCPGQAFDLASVQVEDANFTGGTISFHSASPAAPENELPGSIVTPASSTTYFLQVTSPQGCTDEMPVAVGVKPGPSLSFIPADSFGLCRESLQAVAVQASGGAGDYQYRWSTGATSSEIEVKSAFQDGQTEAYGVTVTDAEGCFSEDTVRITTTVSIEAVRRTVEEVSACMGSDGQITLEPLDGLPPYRFQWSGTSGVSGDTSGIQNELVITGLPQGSYRITITDSSQEACAFLMRSVLVNGPDAVIEEPDITDVSCAGASDGQICLNVEGNNLTYQWNTGDTTQCLDNIPGGEYSVTVTEGMCASVLSGIRVEEPDSLSTAALLTKPSCSDASDGRIEMTAFGGNGNYNFQWADGPGGPARNELPAAAYAFALEDDNGCRLEDTVTLSAPVLLTISLEEGTDISCAAAADGRLKVVANGGTGPYEYQWSTAGTAPLLTQLSPGVYTVTVTDFRNCRAVRSFQIREPAPLRASLAERTDPVCMGDSTGSLGLAVSGGTPGYRYHWSTGDTLSRLDGLGVGDYSVQVEDANGCRTDTLSAALVSQSTLDLNVTRQQPFCQGAADGSIRLQPNGEAPFNYQWANGSTGAELTAVGTGDYPVTIQDSRGCLYDTVIALNAPQEFNVDFSILPPSCHNSSDGVINPVILSGGTPPLQYNWSDGSNAAGLFGVGPGDYALTITDERGCRFASDTLLLESPPPLSVEVVGLGQINCKGDSTGFVELSVAGGVTPYTYNWLNLDAAGNAAFNLTAGAYTVQVLDANNCPADLRVQIPEPPELLVTIDIETSDLCKGGGPNKVTAQISGGVSPYTYQWSTGDQDTVITDIASGDYELTVEDANACVEVVQGVKVRESLEPLRLDTFMVEDISCFGAGDGSMTAGISGGKPPYRFHFSNNQIVVTDSSTVTRTDLPRNNGYNVTVTDLNTGCVVVSDRIPLREPPVLSAKLDSIDQVKCFEGIGGAIYTSAIGGVGPYSYEWRDSSGVVIGMSENLRQIGAGRYTGIVTDAAGCRDTLPEIDLISQNPPLRRIDSLTLVQDARCKGGRSGSVDITITGGAPPYNFNWSNGASTEDLDNLAAGYYALTLTDSEDCRAILAPIMVREPELAISVSGSGENASCYGLADGAVTARVQGGIRPYSFTWIYQGDTIAENLLDLDSLQAGIYTLEVLDEAGCYRSFPFDVGQPDSLVAQIDLISPTGDDPGRAIAQVSGGTPGYTFLWNTGARSDIIDTLRQTGYSVTVTDRNNCTATDTAFLTSVFQTDLVRSVTLFPNPTHGPVRLQVNLHRPLNLRLHLIDEQGRILYRRQYNAVRNELLELDGESRPAGTYRVLLYAEGELVYSGKLLVLR